MDQLTLTPEEARLRELTATELAPARQAQLSAFLLTEIHRRPSRSRGRLLGIIAAFLATLTVAGGVSYAFIQSDRPADPNGAFCYPDQNPDRTQPWTGGEVHTVQNPETGTFETGSALEGCTLLWSTGVVHAPGVTTVVDGTAKYPVPRLVACVDKERNALVFPGPDSLCDTLGFVKMAPEPGADPAPTGT